MKRDLKHDIATMEKVQRKVTSMISVMEKLSYVERIKKLNLIILKTRRKRGYLNEVHKILK